MEKQRMKREIKFTTAHCIQALEEARISLGEYFSDRKYNSWRKEYRMDLPSSYTITERLNGWNNARKMANLKIKAKSKNNIKRNNPQEYCLSALREAKEHLGENLSKKQYDKWQSENKDYPTSRTIVKYFENWKEAKEIVLKSEPNKLSQ